MRIVFAMCVVLYSTQILYTQEGPPARLGPPRDEFPVLPPVPGEFEDPFSRPPRRPLDPLRPERPERGQPNRPSPLMVLNGAFDSTAPLGVNRPIPFWATLSWEPKQNLEAGNGTGLGLLRGNTTFRGPLHEDDVNFLLAGVSVRALFLNGDARFSQTNQPPPDLVWEPAASLFYQRKFENGWQGGLVLTVSSPSDKPFNNWDTVVPGINAFVVVPRERDSWLFSVAWFPTGEIRYPIPGIAYIWMPSQYLTMIIGIPFAVTWRPYDEVRLDFTYVPLRRVRSQFSWEVVPSTTLFAGFEWTNEAYFLDDRIDRKDQMFVFEKRFYGGIRWGITDRWQAEIIGGYVFDRLLFTGRNYTDRKGNRIEVAPGPMISGRLMWLF